MIRLTNEAGSMLYELIRLARQAGKGLPEPLRGFDWQETMQAIDEQREAPEHAADLVDVISAHLMSGGARGGIVGDSLRRMQRAILLPSELAKLRREGDGRPTCRSCQRELVQYEMVTLALDGTLFCSSCEMPTLAVATTTCSRHRRQVPTVEVPTKAIRAIRAAQKAHNGGVCAGCTQEAQDASSEAQGANVTITNPGRALGDDLVEIIRDDTPTGWGEPAGAPEVAPSVVSFRPGDPGTETISFQSTGSDLQQAANTGGAIPFQAQPGVPAGGLGNFGSTAERTWRDGDPRVREAAAPGSSTGQGGTPAQAGAGSLTAAAIANDEFWAAVNRGAPIVERSAVPPGARVTGRPIQIPATRRPQMTAQELLRRSRQVNEQRRADEEMARMRAMMLNTLTNVPPPDLETD